MDNKEQAQEAPKAQSVVFDAMEMIKNSNALFEKLITGEGLGFTDETKAAYLKQLEANGALKNWNQLKKEVEDLSKSV